MLICPYNAITTTSVLEGETIAVQVDEERCNGCLKCVEACPRGMFTAMHASGGVTFSQAKVGNCKACKACEAACTTGAIKVLTA